jgi:hypothetical protein
MMERSRRSKNNNGRFIPYLPDEEEKKYKMEEDRFTACGRGYCLHLHF